MTDTVDIPLLDGGNLRGTLAESSGCRSAVVYVHGLGGHRGGTKAATLREECERRGWTFAAFDFRGHGESSGAMRELTGTRLIEDLHTIQSFLMGRGVEKLVLVGSSMGGWSSAWFAISPGNAVERVVLLAPAFRFLYRRWDALPPDVMIRWEKTGFLLLHNDWIDVELGYGLILDRDRYDPTELMKSWSKPLLIFHGLRDEVVPYAESLEFATGANHQDIELRLIKNGDHRLGDFKQEIAVESCRWFEPTWK